MRVELNNAKYISKTQKKYMGYIYDKRKSSDYKISECRNILEDVDPYKDRVKIYFYSDLLKKSVIA